MSPVAVNAAIFATPPANPGQVPSEARPARILVAQAADTAQLMVRIQQLEEQNRLLNGQVEGLTFQLTEMQDIVNGMADDHEFRFQALVGGGSHPTEAATQAAVRLQPDALPEDPDHVAQPAADHPMTHT